MSEFHRYTAEFLQVMLAAGLSGRGFKFVSVLGEVLADLATVRSRYTT